MPAAASAGRTLLLLFTVAPCVEAQQRTYANPIDIDYRYNFEQQNQGISYRSGADPVIVVQRGKYYLFETIGDGYWESSDLGTWRHITPTRWPLLDVVAPAVLAVRDTIYLLPSTTSPLPILMLTEPASGRVEFYNRLLPWLPLARAQEANVLAKPDSVQPGPWDPQFFYDADTDRWFLYWNSSNAYPLHAIELDKSKRLAYKGTPKWLFGLQPELHGWERFGQDHRDTTIHPFIEGAWMRTRRTLLLCSTARRVRSTTCTRPASTPPTTHSARSPARRTTRLRTSPVASCRAPGTATRSRTSTATGGTRGPRGSR
jgi:hypothetical protein